MVIDQRNAGASVTPSNSYTLDRWAAITSVASKFTVQQSTTVPTGFKNSLLVTSSSAYTVLSSDILAIQQKIEGYNVSDLGWGAAGALTVTLSFWVRSSLTGTFGGSIANSGYTRSYPFSYSISAANTWEQKTITIAGDTTGTWATDNSTGLRVIFGFGIGSTYSSTANAWAAGEYYAPTGSTSVVGTNGATWYITGVQLEQNTTATPFERRLYNQELANCQRYYYRTSVESDTNPRVLVGFNNSTTAFYGLTYFPVTMRVAPTALEQSGTAADYRIVHLLTATACNAVPTFNNATKYSGVVSMPVASGLTAGQGAFGGFTNGGNGYFGWSAEL
jgi:hypothetical protein